MTQVFNAGWALLGIPFIIGAGVGMLYRIEYQLRMYFWYSLATFFLNLIWSLSFLFSGDVCKNIVGKEVQHMGTAFVCGFTDTFVFFWLLMAILINLYCVYIIWSASEEAGRSSYPELIKYSNALKSHLLPLPTGGEKNERKVLKFEGPGEGKKVPGEMRYTQAPVYGSASPPPPPPAPLMTSLPPVMASRPAPVMTSMPAPVMTSSPVTIMPQSGIPQSFIPAPASMGRPVEHVEEFLPYNSAPQMRL
jgi:hypothetical protein